MDKKKLIWLNINGIGLSVGKTGNAIIEAFPENLYKLWHNYTRFALDLAPSNSMEDLIKNPDLAYIIADSGHNWYSGEKFVEKKLSETDDFLLIPPLSAMISQAKYHNGALHFIFIYSSDEEYSSKALLIELLKKIKKNGIFLCYIHVVLYQEPTRETKNDILDLQDKLQKHSLGEIISISYSRRLLDFNNSASDLNNLAKLIYKGVGEKILCAEDALSKILKVKQKAHFFSIQDRGLAAPRINDFDAIFFCNYFFLNISCLIDRLTSEPKSFLGPSIKVLDFYSFLPFPFITRRKVSYLFKRDDYVSAIALLNNKIKTTLITDSASKNRIILLLAKGSNFHDEVIFESKDLFSHRNFTDILIKSIKKKTTSSDFIFVDLPNIEQAASTGSFEKTVNAIKKIDLILGEIEKLISENTSVLLTSLFGMAERMPDIKITSNFRPNATKNPVPAIFIGKKYQTDKIKKKSLTEMLGSGKNLLDLAPTVLNYFCIKRPAQMVGQSLIKEKK